ncbi:MAG: LytTR family DNA-binding domain-containing protein [bacterium]
MCEIKKYKTLIVDDEKYARNDLKEMLASYQMLEIVGEAKNISAALELIEQINPDLIFLDIQFPGELGFDLFDKVNITAKVVFVTAYNEYALRAFEVNACDYLLKPINPDRLALTIKRIIGSREEIKDLPSSFNDEDLIYIQLNYRYYFVKISSIIKIQAQDHFTEITTNIGLKGLTNKSLIEWEACLPQNIFIKIHRSTIINKNYVERIERGKNYSFCVIIKNTENPIVLSRRMARQIKNSLML